MVEIRGSLINGSVASLIARNGDPVYRNILSRLDQQSRNMFETPISNVSWYPLDPFARFLEEDIKVTANGDEDVLVSRAEALHENHMRHIYEGFIGSESPRAFIEHVAILHQLYFKGVSNKIDFVGSNEVIVTYTGFENQHRIMVPSIVGFYRAVMKTAGAGDVHIEYVNDIQDDMACGRIKILWT